MRTTERVAPVLRVRKWGLPIVAAIVLAGCGDDGGGNGDGMGPQGPGNNPPSASFTASPTSVPAGDNHTTVVTLDGSASSDPDGDPLTFNWTAPSGRFTAGTSSTDMVAAVTFPGLGNYTVTLTVSDGRGGTDSANRVISLSP